MQALVGGLLCNHIAAAPCSARKKQKWSVDPRNSAWSNDDNKFGQKMLEQMGWSKGKVSEVSSHRICKAINSALFCLGWGFVQENTCVIDQQLKYCLFLDIKLKVLT